MPLERADGRDDAILVLSDGSHFIGRQFGADAHAVGELVFTTSMTGYAEAVSDPSYAGQILTFSYPLQGNYGFSEEWLESNRAQVRAVVAREQSAFQSHSLSKSSFAEFLAASGIPGISGIDTRAIVRRVRERGVMPAAIAPFDPSADADAQIGALATKIKSYDYGKINFVSEVSPKSRQVITPKSPLKRVVFLDCGAKKSMLRELFDRRIEVVVLPYDCTAEQVMAENPDGFMVSNGPGDPALMTSTIDCIRRILGKVPIFGICLGHQLLAHALGAKTFKLKFGHRGANHAVRDIETGRVYVTSQNHGYAARDLPRGVTPLFENCNDLTNEGLRAADLRAFSCQFHPEGSCGPKDANHLFDEFVKTL